MKIVWIDYLRVLAVFAVVTIHSTMDLYKNFEEAHLLDWWVANVLNGFSRFAVPIFVVISGYLLLGNLSNSNPKVFYTKRCSRLLPPLIFWSLVFAVFDCVLNDKTYMEFLIKITLGFFASGKTYYHLWYLSMFMCLMIFVPFINKMIFGISLSKHDCKHFFIFFVLFFLMNQLSTTAKELADVNITWFKSIPWFLLYLMSGYIIGKYHKDIKLSNFFLLLILSVMLSSGVFLNYVSSYNGIVRDWFVFGNLGGLNYLITCIIFFIFIKNKESFRYNRIVELISKCSFGIYLCHPLFLIFYSYVFNDLGFSDAFFMLLILLLTFFSSFIFICFLRRFGFFKKLT